MNIWCFRNHEISSAHYSLDSQLRNAAGFKQEMLLVQVPLKKPPGNSEACLSGLPKEPHLKYTLSFPRVLPCKYSKMVVKFPRLGSLPHGCGLPCSPKTVAGAYGQHLADIGAHKQLSISHPTSSLMMTHDLGHLETLSQLTKCLDSLAR